MPTFIDMFAGAGGFSEGFLQAEYKDNGNEVAVAQVGVAAVLIRNGVHVFQRSDVVGAHPAVLPCNGITLHAAFV